jgi:hypothetical protein
MWLCQCECGNTVVVNGNALRRGNTRSCGCLQKDEASLRRRTHGMKGTPTYRSWVAMKNRCTNPRQDNYGRYGARGIAVCDRWLGEGGFDAFLYDMGERPEGTTLDRIDPDGNYEPANCRWATAEEQERNKRPRRMR